MIGGQKKVPRVAGGIVDEGAGAEAAAAHRVACHAADFVPPGISRRADDVVIAGARSLGWIQILLTMEHVAVTAVDVREHDPRILLHVLRNKKFNDRISA